MKKIALLAAPVAMFAAIGIAACGPSASPHHLSANDRQQATQAERQAQQIVTGCLDHDHTMHSIERCVAPPDHKVAFEKCALASAHLLATSRPKFEVALDNCVVRYR